VRLVGYLKRTLLGCSTVTAIVIGNVVWGKLDNAGGGDCKDVVKCAELTHSNCWEKQDTFEAAHLARRMGRAVMNSQS